MVYPESSPLLTKEDYLNENRTISEIPNETQFDTDNCDITSDDEVWMVQCPKTMNIDALINRKIKLPGKTNHEHIESIAHEFSTPSTISIGTRSDGSYRIKTIQLQGRVIVRERLKIDKPVGLEEENAVSASRKSERIPLPEGLKVRHPLLGFDYKKLIEINDSIAARLKEAKNPKSKKKNKSMYVESTIASDRVIVKQEPDGDKIDMSINSKSEKRRKRKHTETLDKDATLKSKSIKKESNEDHSLDLEWIKKF